MVSSSDKDVPGEMAALILEVAKPNRPVILAGEGLPISFGSRISRVDGNRLNIVNTVPFSLISNFSKSKNFVIQVDLLRILSDRLESDGKNFIFHATKVESISDTRSDERFNFSSEENVRCEFTNPVDEETVLVKQVLDMSASGFSIRTGAKSTLLVSGRHIEKVRILIGEKLYSESAAEAVYQRKFMDENGKMHLQVGLKFLTAKTNDKTQQT